MHNIFKWARAHFFYIQLNGSKYYYVSLTILLNISHLFSQLKDQTVQFHKLQFSISRLFALSLISNISILESESDTKKKQVNSQGNNQFINETSLYSQKDIIKSQSNEAVDRRSTLEKWWCESCKCIYASFYGTTIHGSM